MAADGANPVVKVAGYGDGGIQPWGHVGVALILAQGEAAFPCGSTIASHQEVKDCADAFLALLLGLLPQLIQALSLGIDLTADSWQQLWIEVMEDGPGLSDATIPFMTLGVLNAASQGLLGSLVPGFADSIGGGLAALGKGCVMGSAVGSFNHMEDVGKVPRIGAMMVQGLIEGGFGLGHALLLMGIGLTLDGPRRRRRGMMAVLMTAVTGAKSALFGGPAIIGQGVDPFGRTMEGGQDNEQQDRASTAQGDDEARRHRARRLIDLIAGQAIGVVMAPCASGAMAALTGGRALG